MSVASVPEISFPRGGSHKVGESRKVSRNETFFKTDETDTRTLSKKSKRKHKDADDQEAVMVMESLTYKNIVPGMTILCCIHEVREYELLIGLPGCIKANVPITNISDSYTNVLQQYADNDQEQSDKVITLHTMFTPGQTLPCRIIESSNTYGKFQVTASLNPKDVNYSLSAASLKHGMVLSCAVLSAEDHGYVMDIGVKGIHGFLSTTAALAFLQSTNKQMSLAIGQLLQCIIDMPDIRTIPLSGRTVKLSAKPSLINKAKVTEDMNVGLHAILPGMVLPVIVTEVTHQGLQVHSLGFDGYILSSNLRKAWDIPDNYEIGHQDQGTVLYIHPVTRNLSISLKTRVNPVNFSKMFGNLHPGSVIQKAVIIHTGKNAAYLKLPNGVKGAAIGTHMIEQDQLDSKFSSDSLIVGSVHRCRVLSLFYLDQTALVTLKESVIETAYISPDELKVGQIVVGKVEKLYPTGILLKLSLGICGFIRNIYISDVPLKKPELQFPMDKSVKCRILEVDMRQYPYSIWLTSRPSLMKSHLPILKTYEDAKPEMVVEGVVTLIKDKGILVSFFGGVSGWIFKQQLNADNPSKAFHVGQIVQCKVMSCDIKNKKLKLSLNTPRINSILEQKSLQVGEVTEVEVMECTNKGLEMKVLSSGKKAFLPKEHLSDFPHLCNLLLESYKPGDREQVVCFKAGKVSVVSKKLLIIMAAKSGEMPNNRQAIKPGICIPGVIKDIGPKEMTVETVGGFFGSVPLNLIANGKANSERIGFARHQTVIAKVRSFEFQMKLSLSTRLSDCYSDNPDDSLDLLESYLRDNTIIRQHLRKFGSKNQADLAELKVGQVINVYVTSVEETGILCKASTGVKGFATNAHLQGRKCSVGDEVPAVVLFVDLENNCLELSLSKQLAHHVQISHDLKIKEGQVIKCTVCLIKKYFVLASLGGHGIGTFVYIPTFCHANDFTGKQKLFTLGKTYHIVIKRFVGDNILCILKPGNKNNTSKNRTGKEKNEMQKKPKKSNSDGGDLSTNRQQEEETNTGKLLRKGKKRKLDDRESIQLKEPNENDCDMEIVESVTHFKCVNEDNDSLPKKTKRVRFLLNQGTDDKPDNIEELSSETDDACNEDVYEIEDGNISCDSIICIDDDGGSDLEITENDDSANSKNRVSTKIKEKSNKKCKIQEENNKSKKLTPPTSKFHSENESRILVNFVNGKCNKLENSPPLKVQKNVGNKPKNQRMKNKIPGEQNHVDLDEESHTEEEDEGYDLVTLTELFPVGKVCKGTIKKTKLTQLKIILDSAVIGRVHISEVSHDVEEGVKPLSAFTVGQKVNVKIIGYYATSSRHSLAVTHKVGFLHPECSLRLDAPPLQEKQMNPGDPVVGYVYKVTQTNVLLFLTPKIKATLHFIDLFNVPIKKFKKLKKTFIPGQAIHSTILAVNNDVVELTKYNETLIQPGNKVLAYAFNSRLDTGLFVKLPVGFRGVIRLTELTDVFEPAPKLLEKFLARKFVYCKIITVDVERRECELSLRDSAVDHPTGKTVVDPVVSDISDLEVGMTLRGYVRAVHETSISVALGRTVKGKLVTGNLSPRMQRNKMKPMLSCGKVVRVKVCSVDRETNTVILSLVEDGQMVNINMKPSNTNEHGSWVSPKKSVESCEEKPHLKLSEGFVWDVDATPNLTNLQSKLGEEQSSSDSDGEEALEKQKKPKTRRERQEELKKEEEFLTKQENLLMMKDREPDCVDDFERLVVASPNSSVVWLQYMAFHLQQAEFDKARAVGNRALQAISFREEQEKLNVWVGLLNLENLFGTKESLDSVFQKALMYNDAQKVYTKMTDIYESSNKMEEAEQIYLKMLKKYKADCEVWIKYGLFMMKNGRAEDARKLMNRSLNSIEKKKHVDVIAKFAQMEFKHGEPERGKTMFQSILNLYPKRKDLKAIFEHLTCAEQEDDVQKVD